MYHLLGRNDLTVVGSGEKLNFLNSNETVLKRVSQSATLFEIMNFLLFSTEEKESLIC